MIYTQHEFAKQGRGAGVECKKCNAGIPADSAFCMFCGFDQKKTPTARKPKTRGNGTGTVYKRGKTYTAEITLGRKRSEETGKIMRERRFKGGFATKREAIEYIPVLKAQTSRERPALTLEKIWDNYSGNAMLKLSASKQKQYKTAYKRLSNIKSIPVPALTINDLQDTVNRETSTFYPARDMKNLLSHLYKMAVAQGDAKANLAEFIVLPELVEEEQKPFNESDLKALWKDYGEGNSFTAYILLMIYSGMMPGELFKAKKDMIDWDKQQILGCGMKTKKRKQTPIVIADFMVPVLKDICEAETSEYLLKMNDHTFYKRFNATLARCGIEERTPYTCRHTTATALALGNIAPSIIQEVMRHTQFSTTERYIHKEIDTKKMRKALNKIKK